MNKNAKILGLFATYYENPHGLDEDHHKSSAFDIAKLCYKAMKLKKFKKIVNT